MSGVRKQGKCGACWAFSIIEMLEAQMMIRKSIKTKLSIQEAIDCSQNGNTGCKGGDTCSLLGWLTTSKLPLLTEEQYPFSHDEEQQTCKINEIFNATKPIKPVQILDYTCQRYLD